MLLGRASPQVPQGPFRETRNPRKRVEFVQKIVDSFRRRWTRDVFPLLVPRKKWNTSRRNVQVDDFVMVAEPNTVRQMDHRKNNARASRTGRESEKHQGEDFD